MGGAIISESGGGIIPLRGAASSRNWGAASSGISRQALAHVPKKLVTFRKHLPHPRCAVV